MFPSFIYFPRITSKMDQSLLNAPRKRQYSSTQKQALRCLDMEKVEKFIPLKREVGVQTEKMPKPDRMTRWLGHKAYVQQMEKRNSNLRKALEAAHSSLKQRINELRQKGGLLHF